MPIGALGKAAEIVEILVKHGGASIDDVTNEVDLARSTVYDYLTSLEKLEYVVKNNDTTYRPSMAFLNIGEITRNQMRIVEVVRPKLHELADATEEHASLIIEEHGKGVLVSTIRGEKAVQIDTHDGMKIHLHTTAPGKAILAYLPEEKSKNIIDEWGLPQKTSNTITDPDLLFEELDEIRQTKVAYDHEERIIGMHSIAVPILDKDNKVHGAISVYGPTNRLEGERLEKEIPHLLKRAANIVELKLNYR